MTEHAVIHVMAEDINLQNATTLGLQKELKVLTKAFSTSVEKAPTPILKL